MRFLGWNEKQFPDRGLSTRLVDIYVFEDPEMREYPPRGGTAFVGVSPVNQRYTLATVKATFHGEDIEFPEKKGNLVSVGIRKDRIYDLEKTSEKEISKLMSLSPSSLTRVISHAAESFSQSQ